MFLSENNFYFRFIEFSLDFFEELSLQTFLQTFLQTSLKLS
jgi:hypothetical protein